MAIGYGDPFEALFALQRALENRISNGWLGSTTTSTSRTREAQGGAA